MYQLGNIPEIELMHCLVIDVGRDCLNRTLDLPVGLLLIEYVMLRTGDDHSRVRCLYSLGAQNTGQVRVYGETLP